MRGAFLPFYIISTMCVAMVGGVVTLGLSTKQNVPKRQGYNNYDCCYSCSVPKVIEVWVRAPS